MDKKSLYISLFEGYCDDNYGAVKTGGKMSIEGVDVDLSEDSGKTKEPRKVKGKAAKDELDYGKYREHVHSVTRAKR